MSSNESNPQIPAINADEIKQLWQVVFNKETADDLFPKQAWQKNIPEHPDTDKWKDFCEKLVELLIQIFIGQYPGTVFMMEPALPPIHTSSKLFLAITVPETIGEESVVQLEYDLKTFFFFLFETKAEELVKFKKTTHFLEQGSYMLAFEFMIDDSLIESISKRGDNGIG